MEGFLEKLSKDNKLKYINQSELTILDYINIFTNYPIDNIPEEYLTIKRKLHHQNNMEVSGIQYKKLYENSTKNEL